MIGTLKERFLSKVKEGSQGECWEWLGHTHKIQGYGKISSGPRGGSPLQAHRVAWEVYNGPIPKGMCVCHKCDNPPCVNPNHLFLGMYQDNIQDMMVKGRGRSQFEKGCTAINKGYRKHKYYKHGKPATEVVCGYCGRLFIQRIDHLKLSTHNYCSVSCANRDRKNHKKEMIKVPTKRVIKDGKPGYQWGNGKVYTYTPGDKASRERARKKAEKQGRAVRSTGWRES